MKAGNAFGNMKALWRLWNAITEEIQLHAYIWRRAMTSRKGKLFLLAGIVVAGFNLIAFFADRLMHYYSRFPWR
jgi:hypothetical protein